MYLIENAEGYFVRGDKAYKISFGEDGEIKVDKKDFIEVENQPKYTYNELIAKLNVKYMLEQAKLKAGKNGDESEELKSLKEENKELRKEIEEKNDKIAELELQVEELQKEPVEENKAIIENEQPKEEIPNDENVSEENKKK